MKHLFFLLALILCFHSGQAAFVVHPPKNQQSLQLITHAGQASTYHKLNLFHHSNHSDKSRYYGVIGFACLLGFGISWALSATYLYPLLIVAEIFGLLGLSPKDKFRTLAYITVAVPLIALSIIFLYIIINIKFVYA